MIIKRQILKSNYTMSNAEWIEYGDYWNWPESLESKIRIKRFKCICQKVI